MSNGIYSSSPHPDKTSGMATGSLVCGICGLLCVLPFIGSLLAVILGHLSLGEIRRSEGRIGGRGRAIGGLTTGYIGLTFLPVLAVISIMAGMMLPVLSKAREKARRVNCAGNLKQIGLALLMYSGDNKGHFPTAPNGGVDFGVLADAGYITPSGKVWACPSARAQGLSVHNSNYIYVGSGLNWEDNDNAPNTVIVFEASGNHPGNSWMNALFMDGHVEGARPDGSKGWNKN